MVGFKGAQVGSSRFFDDGGFRELRRKGEGLLLFRLLRADLNLWSDRFAM